MITEADDKPLVHFMCGKLAGFIDAFVLVAVAIFIATSDRSVLSWVVPIMVGLVLVSLVDASIYLGRRHFASNFSLSRKEPESKLPAWEDL